ncbi:MAG: hypothetical protein SFY56_05675 [Bacteroidota bacterium]|nr:hypothetical protein [Bacteroidota bacterium]
MIIKNKFILFLLIICGCIHSNNCFAQSLSAARYEINAKRIGVYPTSKDALPRSREFIRLDSTYYVGWMFEGLYKYERSGDYMGYKQAIVPLNKALVLLEKDYGDKLKTIFSSITAFQNYNSLFNDYYEIVSNLKLCYNNVEMPDSTMKLLDKIDSYNFQRDFFNIDCDRSWTYHRNRFYTSEKYSFLGNSIEENEALSFKACYNQIARIKKNKSINDYWYGPNQSQEDLLTVYHYLALLHNYNQNYDSSEYYYKFLKDGGRISWSNYANMKFETGNFREAVEHYSKPQYRRKFSLNEEDYFMPMLLVYGAQTKGAIEMAQTKIVQSGSTPGFGWYNIALARSYLYDGQLDSCEFFLDKAANFKELHINTTLTQSHYDFAVNMLKIQLIDKKINLVKFFNTGWWYSISDLYDVYTLKLEKLLLEYIVVNALSHNPERKRVVYDLFCGESVITFDESMFLLKDFSLPYFKKKYEQYENTDSRKRITRYFKLFSIKFKHEDGDEEEAAKDAKQLLNDCTSSIALNGEDEKFIDNDYEKLFVARLYEIIAQNESSDQKYTNLYYNEFPQLVPFSGVKVKMKVDFMGLTDDVTEKVVDNLKDCNIDFVDETYSGVARAKIEFEKKGNSYRAVINLVNDNNKVLVSNAQVIFKDAKGVGQELALRLFGKGGAVKL